MTTANTNAVSDNRLLIPLAEACCHLSLPPRTVYPKLADPGFAERLGAVKVLGRWKVLAEAVERIASEGLDDVRRNVAPAQADRVFQRVDYPHFRRR